MSTFLAITGWLASAFFALAYVSCRFNKLGWKRLYEEQKHKFHEIEGKYLAQEWSQQDLDSCYEKVRRLTIKCDAICSQLRKMKGRGKAECIIEPIRRF